MSAALRGVISAIRSPFGVVSIGGPSGSIVRRLGPVISRATISTTTPRLQNDSVQPLNLNKIPSIDWATNSPTSVDPGTPSIPPSHNSKLAPRLGPTAGRSVAVRGGDVAGALMQLRRVCHENQISRDSFAQRFYERPGIKKKRLRRERFRRRFKESFKRMVSTVLEMKRQGI